MHQFQTMQRTRSWNQARMSDNPIASITNSTPLHLISSWKTIIPLSFFLSFFCFNQIHLAIQLQCFKNKQFYLKCWRNKAGNAILSDRAIISITHPSICDTFHWSTMLKIPERLRNRMCLFIVKGKTFWILCCGASDSDFTKESFCINECETKKSRIFG